MFTEEQAGGVFVVLSHLGWSPQRMTSRARSYTRQALKHVGALSALAREAEEGPMNDDALFNIRQLASYKRLMIAGMLGDLALEHQLCVHRADTRDPDPAELDVCVLRFNQRVLVPFHGR